MSLLIRLAQTHHFYMWESRRTSGVSKYKYLNYWQIADDFLTKYLFLRLILYLTLMMNIFALSTGSII